MINQLFDLMDKWRHFPNWQLERRADIFFALYLKEILAIRGINNIRGIIPEFPVRIGAIDNKSDSNKSYKIDYVAITGDCVYLVELKTDLGSRRGEQDKYLQISKEKGFDVLLNGLLDIYKATKAKNKYQYMLNALCDAKVLSSESNDYSSINSNLPSKIIYIQPTGTDEKDHLVISFSDIVSQADFSGEFGNRFKKSLSEWSDVRAGEST